VLDGELVAFNDEGDPHFPLLARRTLSDDRGIPITLMVFDVLAIDGETLLTQPYSVGGNGLRRLASTATPGRRRRRSTTGLHSSTPVRAWPEDVVVNPQRQECGGGRASPARRRHAFAPAALLRSRFSELEHGRNRGGAVRRLRDVDGYGRRLVRQRDGVHVLRPAPRVIDAESTKAATGSARWLLTRKLRFKTGRS
jgi:hypothetical protein